MTIWKYEESTETHRLVKIYREDHGEGEYMGDMDEESIREMIRKIKPDMNLDQAYGTLAYFGMLPILVTKKS
ncbi:hypothetical protein [Sulfurovum riftiae]|uniref:Uncharacterized protein n=1 Tax=Sulfurovum riftiae TaxID=1630136 RepID=A0A151CH14_9BACT|nr:hypothetical protein [Sulfurovum riftiae]KYJ86832.1 hypothetical protein AS592_08380 [Sulfurovum riftiae]